MLTPVAWDQPWSCLLPAQTQRRIGSAHHACDGSASSGFSLHGFAPANANTAATRLSCGQISRAHAHDQDGHQRHRTPAGYEQAKPPAQGISLSVAQAGDSSQQSSLGAGYDLYPDGARLCERWTGFVRQRAGKDN